MCHATQQSRKSTYKANKREGVFFMVSAHHLEDKMCGCYSNGQWAEEIATLEAERRCCLCPWEPLRFPSGCHNCASSLSSSSSLSGPSRGHVSGDNGNQAETRSLWSAKCPTWNKRLLGSIFVMSWQGGLILWVCIVVHLSGPLCLSLVSTLSGPFTHLAVESTVDILLLHHLHQTSIKLFSPRLPIILFFHSLSLMCWLCCGNLQWNRSDLRLELSSACIPVCHQTMPKCHSETWQQRWKMCSRSSAASASQSSQTFVSSRWPQGTRFHCWETHEQLTQRSAILHECACFFVWICQHT